MIKIITDVWEQRKLGNLVSRRSRQIEDFKLPSIEYEDITAGSGALNKDIYTKNHHKRGTIFEPNDTLFGKLRPYLDNRLFPNFKGVAVGDFWVLDPIDIVPEYLYALIQSELFQAVANQTSGTKMPRSDWAKVSGTCFIIPTNKTEQVKIGLLFQNIDDAIALHQHN